MRCARGEGVISDRLNDRPRLLKIGVSIGCWLVVFVALTDTVTRNIDTAFGHLVRMAASMVVRQLRFAVAVSLAVAFGFNCEMSVSR